MTSEEITATVDPTIFASIMEKTSFSFSVSISNVTTNDKNTVISSSLSTLPVIINKAAYCNLKSGIPSNSQLISNRAGWIINVEEGVEGAPNNLIDGKSGTQNITFISPITTRYLKYQIITISTNGRTDVTEFNVYEPKSE